MSVHALLRCAPLVDSEALRAPEAVDAHELYQRGGMTTLGEEPVPVVVDHDAGRSIGRVVELFEAPDTGGGEWLWARVELDEPPAWLRRDLGVSIAYASAGSQTIGSWRRVLRGVLTHVAILPPEVEPRHPRARVAWLGQREAVGGEQIMGGERLVRRGIGQVLGVR